MAHLDLWVPKPSEHEHYGIARGSAIVSAPSQTDKAGNPTIYFEGDIYGGQMDFAEKLIHAADRCLTKYPTRAKMAVEQERLEHIGTYDSDSRRVHYLPNGLVLLTWWCEPPKYDAEGMEVLPDVWA